MFTPRTDATRTVQDTVKSMWRLVLPQDRPMPIFTMLLVIANGAQLTYSFPVLLSLDCRRWMAQWCAIGTANTIVNMLYPIALMWRTRRRIDEGIPMSESTARLFFMEPVRVCFFLFIVWEVVWMSHYPQMPDSSASSEACASYNFFLVIFCSVCLVLGLLLDVFTFMTEFGRTPRWRVWANERWRQRQEIFSLVHYGVPHPPGALQH
uniref:Uncharacterized protein TCIL3000_11_5240 n=1 Tax=Trypanosoma congolense (strain IL3000) TaxID=1068625 RepID=G0V0E2_TRYCI|nr:unnamed protein product [Trypanosoma congolense IL3000]